MTVFKSIHILSPYVRIAIKKTEIALLLYNVR